MILRQAIFKQDFGYDNNKSFTACRNWISFLLLLFSLRSFVLVRVRRALRFVQRSLARSTTTFDRAGALLKSGKREEDPNSVIRIEKKKQSS